jgi:hypothetical protein
MVLLLGKATCYSQILYKPEKICQWSISPTLLVPEHRIFCADHFLHFLWQKCLAKLRQNMALSANDVTKLCNKISEQMLVKYKSTFCAICFNLGPFAHCANRAKCCKRLFPCKYSRFPLFTGKFLKIQGKCFLNHSF